MREAWDLPTRFAHFIQIDFGHHNAWGFPTITKHLPPRIDNKTVTVGFPASFDCAYGTRRHHKGAIFNGPCAVQNMPMGLPCLFRKCRRNTKNLGPRFC